MSTNSKTIWYCHHYAGSPSMGMSYRPYYLTREFVKAGLNAFVISASFHHLLHKKTAQKEKVKQQTIDGVPFVTLKVRSYQKNGLSRFYNILQYTWRFKRQLKKICKITGKPDVIIVSSSHPFHFPLLEKAALKYNATLIFEVRDLWPLSLIELLNLSPRHPVVNWLSRIERKAYRTSDYVVSLLKDAGSYMAARGLDMDRFKVISNGTSKELFQNCASLSADTKKKLNGIQASGAFLMGYAGALGEPNAMQYLIEAMALLQAQTLPIHCVILGEGQQKTFLEEKVIELNLNNVSFFAPIPKFEVPAFIKGLDGLYLGWNKTDLYQFGVSPNKLFDYMMSGKPIIESGGPKESIIDTYQCGIRTEAANPKEIAKAIKALYETTEAERKAMGLRGIKAIETTFDYEILAKEYLTLFN